MRTRIWKWLPAALLLLVSAAYAGTFEKTLDNGLKVIVKEDHRAPVVVQQVWYRVGSMDEVTGRTGISHALEHMMFKGTKAVPAGQFSARIAAAGGRENAFTSYDYTAFFQMLEKSRLALAMQLESDRMQNLLVPDAEFAKEIQVVMEERRWRTDDDPHSLLQEEMMAAAFQEHPYHNPVIGWMDDLKVMTAADVRQWYHRWYVPSNAVLVVVGDVKAEKVFAMAQKYYGAVPARKLAPRRVYEEPKQRGVRRIELKAPAELPRIIMAYRAPALRNAEKDWRPYALQVLVQVLDGNGAARLNKTLVRKQRLASDIDVEYDPISRGPDLVTLDSVPSQGKTVQQVEAGIKAQLNQVIRHGVSAEEVKRAKAQITATETYHQDSIFYQGMQIGQIESVGLSYKDIPLLLKKLQAVTPAQVQQVAKEIFTDDALTVAVLDPQPLSGRIAHAFPGGSQNVR